jgi:LytS/YehU family sensor histidine kinase
MGTAPHAYFRLSYTESIIYMPQHIFLSYGIIYFVLPKFILQNQYWKGLAGIILLILCAAVLSPIMQILFIYPLRESLSVPIKNITFFHSFMAGLRGSMTVAGFAVAIKLVKHWYFKKVAYEVLEKEKLKAELQLLKGQLQPHFIFNTLNSIYSLSLKRSEEAPAAILKLSELMRYVFAECNDAIVPLSKEIQTLHNYIELGRARFRERLDVAVDVSGDFENQGVPPLLFLPFLENSFKYGTNDLLDNAWISLALTVKENVLKFKLINGKAPACDIHSVSSGIGLQNVKKRLNVLYPNAHTLRITEDADTYIVQLNLQLDKIRLPQSDEEIELLASR